MNISLKQIPSLLNENASNTSTLLLDKWRVTDTNYRNEDEDHQNLKSSIYKEQIESYKDKDVKLVTVEEPPPFPSNNQTFQRVKTSQSSLAYRNSFNQLFQAEQSENYGPIEKIDEVIEINPVFSEEEQIK